MLLERFRVTNFRSIKDSGWIECDNVTSLVGINEAGKSNIILALWKFNPVRDGKIEILHDMPTKEYALWRNKTEEIKFIEADFKIDEELKDKILKLHPCIEESVNTVRVSRYYNGLYVISFPNFKKISNISNVGIKKIVDDFKKKLEQLEEKTKSEAGIKGKLDESVSEILKYLEGKLNLSESDHNNIKKFFPKGLKVSATSEIYPVFQDMKDNIKREFSVIEYTSPSLCKEVRSLIVSELPSFVYYSNYGNLDAQIYLPHAVKWLNGEKVEGIENDAKVRTLRVLFDFVQLNPQEVLDLGKDPVKIIRDNYGNERETVPTDSEIAKMTEQKTERAILLNSASVELTRKFKEWWKQGNYKFRFQADGEFFKIWVSDEKRQEEIELERRSTGLQWFLSFFLVFLVESREAHKGAILLLDEAGLSLHPLAQRDLITFFDNLSKTNQLIYTTHSPFLVDTTNIDRVKVVYSDDEGLTVASSDLRAADDKLNEKSIYAVHAALGLSVSDILLQGCCPIIVEGPSDQYYLNAIKIFLIKNKKFTPKSELVFIPSGGVKGVAGIASIVGGKNGNLPLVILDSDSSGKMAKSKLESGLYNQSSELIIEIGEFLDIDNNGEIEDLIPADIMFRQINRLFKDVDEDLFEDAYNAQKPIVNQINTFADEHGVNLQKGWKVDLAKAVKQQLLKLDYSKIPEKYVNNWSSLFEKFE